MKKKLVRKSTPQPVTFSTIQTLHFSRNDLTLSSTPFGLQVSMKGFETDGLPGAPALPHRIVHVALPKRHVFKKLSITTESAELVIHTPQPVVCIQEPAIGPAPELPHSRYQRSFVMPDPTKYQYALDNGKRVCRFVGEEMMGLIPCALIELWPVRFTKEGLLELVQDITLTVVSAPSDAVALKERENARRFSAKRIVRQHLFAEDIVVNRNMARKELRRSVANLQRVATREAAALKKGTKEAKGSIAPNYCDYLIITDNNQWNAVTIQPNGVIGDMASKFQVLANWK